jgi:hypothetical protein
MKFIFTICFLLLLANLCFGQISIYKQPKNSSDRNKNVDIDLIKKTNESETNSYTLLGALNSYYVESFEGAFPPIGWKIADPRNTEINWISSVLAAIPASYDGNKSAYMPYGFLDNIPASYLISPAFTVAEGDSLSFKFKLEFTGWIPDTTEVLISTTDDNVTSFTKRLLLLAEGLNYPKDSINWYNYSFSLNEFVGKDIYVAFKNRNGNGDGVFIDFIEMGDRPIDVSTSKILVNEYIARGNQDVFATIANNSNDVQNISTKLYIDNQLLSSKIISAKGTSLAEVNFGNWDATEGSHVIQVVSSVEGDVNSINDTLNKSVKAFERLGDYGWSVKEDMPIFRYSGITGSIHENDEYQYFYISGIDENIVPSNNNYSYNSKFETWEEGANIKTPVWFSNYETINDKIYCFNGVTSTGIIPINHKTQIYEMKNDTWSEGKPSPLPLTGCASGLYNDSLIYLIGGNDQNSVYTNRVQIYNINTDKWVNGTSKPGTPSRAIKGSIVGNKIVISNGLGANGRVSETYIGTIDTNDPAKISWKRVEDHPIKNLGLAAVFGVSNNGQNLVIFTAGHNGLNNIHTTFAFDIDKNKWLIGSDKISPFSSSAFTKIVKNDSLYLACLGGFLLDGSGNLYAAKVNEWLNLGKYEATSSTIELDNKPNLSAITSYPNPSDNISNIQFSLTEPTVVDIKLVDLLGRFVADVMNRKLDIGLHVIPTDVKYIPAGEYQYIITINGKSSNHKMIKI